MATPEDTLNMALLPAEVACAVFETAVLSRVLYTATVTWRLRMDLIVVAKSRMCGCRGVAFGLVHRRWCVEDLRVLLRRLMQDSQLTRLVEHELGAGEQTAL